MALSFQKSWFPTLDLTRFNMRLYKWILGVAVIFFTATACNNNPYEGEISELESLSKKVDSLDHILSSVNADTLAKWNAYANSRASVIKRKLTDTAFAEKHIEIISEVIADAKYLQKLSKARSEFSEELTYTREQLEKLMVDLKSEALDSADVYEYLNAERLAVLELENDIIKRVPLATTAIAKLDSISVELDSLMNYMDDNGYFTP